MGGAHSPIAVCGQPDGGARLELRGSVTILVGDQLLAAAREAAAHDTVTVDLAEAEHIDLCGLQVLLALRRHVTERAGRFAVVNIPNAIRRFLGLSGLEQPLLSESFTWPARGGRASETAASTQAEARNPADREESR